MYDSILTWFEILPSLAKFVLVVVVVFATGHYLGRPIMREGLREAGVAEPIRDAVEDSYSIVLVFLTAVLAVAVTDVDAMPTSSGAIIAAVTLSAGIGTRTIVRNLVSGLFIVNSEDIDIGSWIEWSDRAGVVEAMSLRATKIRTFDDETVIVPNSKLTDDVVVNPTSSGRLRIRYPFGIGYEADVDEAIRYVREEAESIEGVADDPEPTVRVIDLDASAVELDARVWLDGQPSHSDAVRVRSALIKRVKTRLQNEGISMSNTPTQTRGSLDVSAADEG